MADPHGASAAQLKCSASPRRLRPRSAPHETGTPEVERALLVLPAALLDIVGDDLELGRDLDEIALRVLDHEEEIVARPVAPGSPPERDPEACHVVGPVAQRVPGI